jgi:hypothetical protein
VTKSTAASTRRRGRPPPKRQDRRWVWALLAVGILLVVGLLVARQMSTGSSDIAGVETFSNLAQTHQDGPLSYPQTPPVGGTHNPAWLNCGVYDQPVPNENAVHSLEHGAVWITYRPDLPAADVDQLRGLVRGRRYALLSPYPDLPAPVVASAWGVQLKVDGASDARLQPFITKYMQGSQTPELGAPCTGGVGTPSSR